MIDGTYGARICYDEPNEGAGGGTPPAGGDKPLTAKELTELKSEIGNLTGGIKDLLKFAAIRQEQGRSEAAGNAPPPAEEEEDDVDEATLEAMPRRAFTDFLLKEFNKNLEKNLKPIQDQVVAASVHSQTTQMEVQAREFASQHEDFADWKDEMVAIAEQHSNLPIARIYSLARAESPEKAAKLDKAIKARKESETDSGPRRENRRPALTPSGGGGEGKPPARMNAQDAATAAWDEAVARFGNPFA
jgi:hypothetical protein